MSRLPRSRRSAFTLIELIVVLLIILILVGLLGSAVLKALAKIPEVQTRTEIAEMDAALHAFMTDYGLTDPPPSYLVLNEATPLAPGPADVGGRSAAFLTKVFGKNLGAQGAVDWNGNGTIDAPYILQGEQCLVFYLGGIPNTLQMATGTPPSPLGFSTNNMNPAMSGGKRRGPYFPFNSTRLFPSPFFGLTGGMLYYVDPWQTKSSFYVRSGYGGAFYVYFSSNGINNGYNPADCNWFPYTDLLGSHPPMPYSIGPGQYTNSNGYQIISAGKDGMFGYNPATLPLPSNIWSPNSGAVGTGADDQTNFSAGLLGVGQY